MMRDEMWPRRQRDISSPRRKPTALCPVGGPCFAWVPSARAGHHSREEESSLPVRPWSAVDPYPRSTPFIQVKQQNELGPAVNGHLADHHQFPFAHTLGRSASIDADIARHRRADRGASGPFDAEGDPGHQGPHRRRPERSAGTPGARAGGVLHQKERSQPTPVAVARCGNQHVGGGCCASSRSLP